MAAQSGETAVVDLPENPVPMSVHLYSVGERQQALDRVRKWIQQNVNRYLYVYDPFFTVRDLDILAAIPGGTQVRILTSPGDQRRIDGSRGAALNDLEDIYASAWRQRFDQDPPPTSVFVIGTRTGKTPLHDRYLLTDGAGLRLGTSISGLGSKETELAELNAEQAKAIEAERVTPWLGGQIVMMDGERVRMHAFPLGD